jgi:nucleoside-diphosphate-sugar epimerase
MIPIKGRRIVLIGGAGFIGHNLALHLKDREAEVFVIDGLQVNNLLAFVSSETAAHNRDLYLEILNQRMNLLHRADIPLYVQDARDYHSLNKLLNDKIKPQVIVHLAAVAHADRSNKDPYSTFDHSFRTLENALDCARGQVEHFIYFSSSMVYGHFQRGTVAEETPCEPLGIYGALKFGGEKLVIAYNQAFDLPYTIIRPSALYGERCVSRRVGQIFIENAIQNTEITIKGDGADRLDFTYIGDLVNGIAKVLENENSLNQTFNLTYGEARSLADMASILEEHFPNVKITYMPKDKLTPDRGTLSVEKAKKLIGYEPMYPLEKGFAKYVDWYKQMTKGFNGRIEVGFING